MKISRERIEEIIEYQDDVIAQPIKRDVADLLTALDERDELLAEICGHVYNNRVWAVPTALDRLGPKIRDLLRGSKWERK